MKITFTALGAVRSTLEYFLSEAGYAPRAGTGTGKRARYYAGDTGEHLHASAWFGRGAEALGLTGRVRARDFERVLRGEVPGADVVLRRNRDGAQEHRTGWDMTVSAPKSVSVAWGVQGDERVLGEFVESVRSAFRVMEARHLETRVYDPETKRRERVAADGLVMATFVHVSNRNDEPQVHLHGVVLNMTRSARGEWRSLEPTPLARHARLIGNIAGNALAGRLRGLGYAIAARRIGRLQSFEIAGYPRWLLDRFSTRRGEILRHLAETGRRLSTRTAQMAAFATRRRKSGLRTQALREQWRAQVEAEPRLEQALVGALYESHRAAPGDTPVPTALESVCRAVEHLAERTTLLRERDILATALLLEPGRHGLDALEAALERRLRDRHLLEARAYRGGGRAFVASREFADERALVAWMKAGRGTGRALAARDAVEARLGDTRHTAGQKEAVRLILLEPHRAVAVQGFAGTGKTTMLREVVGLAGGVPVFGLAPSAAAARVLGHEAGIGARTVDWFLTRFGTLRTGEACPATRALARELCGDGILVVDESSMLSTAQLRALARLAERIGVARVVLCGDHRQLHSVRPGQPFKLLQEAGMQTAVMDEIVRQRNPVIRKAVRDALSGRPARALARLAERIEEVPAQALAETAAREFLALPDAERDATLLVAPTHALRHGINAVVREGLVEEGKIRGPALVVERLIDLHLTASEKAQVSSYQPDDEVVFVQDLLRYRVRNAEACVVTGVDGARVALRHPDGKPRHIAPAGRIRYHIKICESVPIELRAGDWIRWTHNDHRRGLLNGERATVERIGERDVTLRSGGGAKHVLDAADPQLRHVDHAYAATTHAAQGSTCERVIAVLDADPMPLTSQATFYVQISRAREEVVLLTDDLEQLIETLEEQSGERMSAHQVLGATPEGGGAAARARRRGYERVRREWRRVRRRARIEQRPERYASGYAEVHEQVARLDEDDALPGYQRRFVDDWLGDHVQGERQLRDIETVIREARRRARGPPAGGQEDARDDADTEASGDSGAGEALALARTIAGDALAYGPHLDADDALRERFDDAHPVLEAAAFANAHDTIERHATETRTIKFYASGYAALLDDATRLDRADLPLDPDTRALVSEVLREDEQRRGERERIEAFIESAQSWEGALAPEARWDDSGAALLGQGRSIHEDTSQFAAHLQGDEDLGGRFGSARAALETAAFVSAHRNVMRQAAEGGTTAVVVRGFPELLDHARRVHESTLALPEDIRTLATGVLREAAERQRDVRRIARFLACARRRAAARTRDPTWTRRDEALLRRARILATDQGRYAPHLAAGAHLRQALDAAHAALEAAAFANEHETVRRQAVEGHTIALYAPGYAALLERATALSESTLSLDADTRTLVSEVLREDEQRRGERERIEAFIESAQTWEEAQAREARWDDSGAALLEQGRKVHEDASQLDAHLQADEDLRGRFGSALAALETVAFRSAHEAVMREAARANTNAYYAPGHGALVEHATRLEESDLPLDADTRGLVAEVVRQHAKLREALDRIKQLITDAERWKPRRAGGARWDDGGRAALVRARAIHDDTSSSHPHLAADDALRQAFEAAHAGLEAAAFTHEHETVKARAAADHTIAFYAPGYAALLDDANRLGESELPLDADTRALACAVSRQDPQHRTEADRIKQCMGDVAAWREGQPEQGKWDDAGAALLDRIRSIASNTAAYGPHLAADDVLRKGFERFQFELQLRAFIKQSDIVEWQAAESMNDRYFVPAYPALLDHATHIARSRNPRYGDYLTETREIVRQGAERRAEAHAIRTWIVDAEAWCEGQPATGRWDEAGMALRVRAQDIEANEFPHDRHLAADDTVCRDYEAARGALEAAAIRDAFESVERQVAASEKIAFYAPDYRVLLRHARALEHSELPLPEDTAALVCEVLREDGQRRGERERIEGFIAAAQTWEAERASEAKGDETGTALLEQAGAMLEDTPPLQPHLEGDPKLRRRFQGAFGALHGAALCNDYAVLENEAARRGTAPCHDPGHGELLARVHRLRRLNMPLPKEAQRLADRVVREDAQAREALRHIDTFLEDAERRHRERARGSPWGGHDKALWRRALEIDDDKGRCLVNLDAIDFMPTRFERACCVLEAEADHHAHASAATRGSPQAEQDRPYALDCASLVFHVSRLTQAVRTAPDTAEEALAEPRIDEPAGPHRQRTLEEFFAWCAFRQLERERGSDNDWNELDEALWEHAQVVNAGIIPDDAAYFDDAESRRRFEQAHADLAGRAFCDAHETLREEAFEQETIAFHAPDYPGHLERAQWLNDAQLPLSADARERVTAVLREDAERREEIRRIAQFVEDVHDWKRRRVSGAQWDEAGAALLERGRRACEDIPHLYEHLEADAHLGAEFALALGVLEGAQFASVHARMEALARERKAMPRHLEEYGDVYLDASMLVEDGSIGLPDEVRELVDEVLRHAPEERPRAAHDPQTQHAKSEAVATAPPSAERAPQPRSTTTHEAVPGAGDVCRTGEPLIRESFEMARRQVEIERQDRQAEAETRNIAKRLQEEQESATKRESGSGRRM